MKENNEINHLIKNTITVYDALKTFDNAMDLNLKTRSDAELRHIVKDLIPNLKNEELLLFNKEAVSELMKQECQREVSRREIMSVKPDNITSVSKKRKIAFFKMIK